MVSFFFFLWHLEFPAKDNREPLEYSTGWVMGDTRFEFWGNGLEEEHVSRPNHAVAAFL